jgi:hypothetical protein
MAASGNGNLAEELFKKSLDLFKRTDPPPRLKAVRVAPALNNQAWIARQKSHRY